MSEQIEKDLSNLCSDAVELGASQAVAMPVSSIVLDDRAALKCLVPLCSHYGVDLMCPPNIMPPAQFRSIIGSYRQAILIKLDVPPDNSPPAAGAKTDFINYGRDVRLRLHNIVCRLESSCLQQGYYFAAGLIGGSCPLCEECVGVKSGQACQHPFKARPSMEAMGIDVMATAKNGGMRLSFGSNDGRSWIGLVLVG